jgi:hypothetical protein
MPEHLVVEVAPTHLAGEGFGTRAAHEPRHDLQWRQAAEVEVGADPRGRVAREVVVVLAVGCEPVSGPRLQTRPRCGLAARDHGGRTVARGEGTKLREVAPFDAVRERQAVRHHREHPAGSLEPAAVVRREHLEVTAASGRDRAGRHHTDTLVAVHGDPCRLAFAFEADEPPARKAADVVAHMDLGGAGDVREPERLGDPIPSPHHEPGTERNE